MKIKLSFILSGLIFILFLSFCNKKPAVSLSPYLNHHDSVKYTGIRSCLPCHKEQYETFVHTGMGMSFDSANLKKSSADFKSIKPVYDPNKDLYYFPFVSNGNLMFTEFRLLGKDTVYSRTEKISYIIGSGHHTNSHLWGENQYLFQAPLTFYTQKGQWDLPPGFENGNNTRFERKIGLECMSCHNAIPKMNKESENQYLRLPSGIDCERCHGPGEIHIREMQKGNTVDVSRRTDFTIVNPRKLSWQRQIDICQRCHLQGNAVLKPGKDFTQFRPGMRLNEIFDQFSPDYEGEEDFVMAAHAERFQKSKCFITSTLGDIDDENSRPGFTCISCHNPHVSVRLTNTDQFNKTCSSCHSETKGKLCSESASEIQRRKNNCVSCHMPVSGTADIPHVSVHDHYIRKPDQSIPVPKGRLKGLRCITSDNPGIHTETEAYISYYEKFDPNPLYIKKAREKSLQLNPGTEFHFQTLIHLYYVGSEYKKICDLAGKYKGGMDAWTAYRIAKAMEKHKKGQEADPYYAMALEMQPDNLDFILQYAVHQIKTKQWKKAEQNLMRYNRLFSKTAEVWAYLGLVKMNANELNTARQYFYRSLQLDPDQLIALNNLKILYTRSREFEKIRKLDQRIIAIGKRKS